MKKYKYKVVSILVDASPKGLDVEELALNTLGQMGWELVSVVPVIVKGTVESGICYFKRDLE